MPPLRLVACLLIKLVLAYTPAIRCKNKKIRKTENPQQGGLYRFSFNSTTRNTEDLDASERRISHLQYVAIANTYKLLNHHLFVHLNDSNDD